MNIENFFSKQNKNLLLHQLYKPELNSNKNRINISPESESLQVAHIRLNKNQTFKNSDNGSYMYTLGKKKTIRGNYPDKKNRKRVIRNLIDMLKNKKIKPIISFKEQIDLMTICFTVDKSINFEVDAWININKKGDYNEKHNHPNCHLAGVLYLKCPQDCGNIVLDASLLPLPNIIELFCM